MHESAGRCFWCEELLVYISWCVTCFFVKPLFYPSSFGRIFGLSPSAPSKSSLWTKDFAGNPQLVIFDGFNAEERSAREADVEKIQSGTEKVMDVQSSKMSSSTFVDWFVQVHFFSASIFLFWALEVASNLSQFVAVSSDSCLSP